MWFQTPVPTALNESHYQQSHAGALLAFQQAKVEDSSSDLPPIINHFRSDRVLPPSFFSGFFQSWVCSVAVLAPARFPPCCWGCGAELDSNALAAQGGCWGMIPAETGNKIAATELAVGWGNWEGPDSWGTGGCTGRGWFACSPALSTSAGCTSVSPRSPLRTVRHGVSHWHCSQLDPAMGTCHPLGTPGPPQLQPCASSALQPHHPSAAGNKEEASLSMEAATCTPAGLLLPS